MQPILYFINIDRKVAPHSMCVQRLFKSRRRFRQFIFETCSDLRQKYFTWRRHHTKFYWWRSGRDNTRIVINFETCYITKKILTSRTPNGISLSLLTEKDLAACDIKRSPYRHSLQGGGIQTPFALFRWSTQHIANMKMFYVSSEDVKENKTRLQAWLSEGQT